MLRVIDDLLLGRRLTTGDINLSTCSPGALSRHKAGPMRGIGCVRHVGERRSARRHSQGHLLRRGRDEHCCHVVRIYGLREIPLSRSPVMARAYGRQVRFSGARDVLPVFSMAVEDQKKAMARKSMNNMLNPWSLPQKAQKSVGCEARGSWRKIGCRNDEETNRRRKAVVKATDTLHAGKLCLVQTSCFGWGESRVRPDN